MRLHSLAGFAAVPAVRALAVSAVLWLVIFSYCDFALWRDPHGAYFHSEHVYDLDYSRVRQQEAHDLLARYSDSNATNTIDHVLPSSQHASNHPVLCAAFVTVRREHPEAARYFSDSVGSMLAGLSDRERAALNVTVLFANAADPAVHPDFGAPWLTALADHASGYEGLSDAEVAELRHLEEERDFQRKGVLDYLYALDKCYHGTRAPFIAVFEDDIIFAGDWLARTLRGLQHLATLPSSDENQPPWLYLRLFYAETFLTWDAATDWWYGHLFVTLALVSLTSATVLVLLRLLLRFRAGSAGADSSHRTRTLTLGLRLDVPTIAVLAVIVAPAFTALTFMAGKYNLPMYAFRGGSHAVGSVLRGGPAGAGQRQRDAGVVPMDHQGCCSQALVFDRARVPGLMAHLRERGRGQTDLMIEDYCRDAPLLRFALGEQAVQHVGVASSRGSLAEDARSVWAFYFETQKADAVQRRQQSALAGIDWALFEAMEGPER